MTIRDLSIKVKNNVVKINNIELLQSTKEVLCISVDFNHKYPVHCGCSVTEKSITCYFESNNIPETDLLPSEIKISRLPSDWYIDGNIIIAVDTGRYHAHIVIVRKNSKKKHFNFTE